MIINCAIIDDEYLARKYLCEYVSKIPFLNLIGDYDSPLLVLNMLKANEIDLMFLDIQMPDISGLEFLKTLNPPPCVIITTAYKEYALEGYEFDVTDYLLKPVSFDRFLKAVNKAVDKLQSEKRVYAEVSEPENQQPTMEADHIIIRADRKWYRINYNDIWFIEGQKAYVTFHTKTKKITALFSLKDLEEKLPCEKFIRIHKSYIVSKRNIETLEGNMIGICGMKLAVGSNYRESVLKLFNIKSEPFSEDNTE